MHLPPPLILVLALALGACSAHAPPRCAGKLEPINVITHPQTPADGDGK